MPFALFCLLPRAFLFPSDQRIEMEYWAESTEFDPSELHQMRIQDNQLFAISPKAGKLLPGQEQAIHLSYRYLHAVVPSFPMWKLFPNPNAKVNS